MKKKKVILSIKPKYVEKILSGTKTIELRRCIWNLKDILSNNIERIYIYSSSPTKKVVGEINKFIVNKVPAYIVIKHHLTNLCLTKQEANEYSKGKENMFLIHIHELIIYEKPKELKDFGITRAPQNFCYVS